MHSIPEAFITHSLQELSPEDQLKIARLGLGPSFSESLLFGALLRLASRNRFFWCLAILMCLSAISEDPRHFAAWRLLFYAGFDWLTRKWEIIASRPWLILWSLFFAALIAPTNPLFALYLFCFGLAVDWALEKKQYRLCLPIAWLLSLPLSLLCFPSFSPLASLLNILLSPIFAMFAVLGSACSLSKAYHLDKLAEILHAGLNFSLGSLIDGLSALSITAYWVPWFSAFILFLALALLFRLKNRLFSLALSLLCFVFLPKILSPIGAIVFDIGQGDSIGLFSQSKSPFLVDAGPPPAWHSSLAPIDRQLEANGIGSIEGILITHPDLDHYGGLDALLARHPIEQGIWIHPLLLQSEKADKVLTMLERHRAKLFFLDSASRPYPGLECRLAPAKNSNEISPLCKYGSLGQHQLLLTGDMDSSSEKFYLKEDPHFLKTEALKIAHHGSKTSSSADFLAGTSAKYAFISVGARNRYGHPTRETLDRLLESKMSTWRTDKLGNIFWLQWPILERFLPGRSMVASNSPFGLLRSASSAIFAPE